MQHILQNIAELIRRVFFHADRYRFIEAGIQNRKNVQLARVVKAITIRKQRNIDFASVHVFYRINRKCFVRQIIGSHKTTEHTASARRQNVRRRTARDLKSSEIGRVVIAAIIIEILNIQIRSRRNRNAVGLIDNAVATLRADTRQGVSRFLLRTNRVSKTVHKGRKLVILAVAARYLEGDISDTLQFDD